MATVGGKLCGGHSTSVLCVDVSRLTGQVISGSEDGELCLWSAEGHLVKKITRPDCDCTSVLFSKENANRAYVAFGTEVAMYDLNNLDNPVFTFQSNTDEVNQIVLDSKESFLAACDDAAEVKVYGLQDRKVFKTLRFKHTGICSSAVFRPNRSWEIVSAGLDCRLVHWDFSKPKCLNQFNMNELHRTPGESAYMINPPFVHHVNVSPNGTKFACALENGQVPIFNSSQKNLQSRYALFAHSRGASQVHFITEDKLVTAGNDSNIVLWDLSQSELYQPPGVYMNGDSGTASSPEEQKHMAITELCRLVTIPVTYKVNWMVPSGPEGSKKLYVADQSPDISIIDLDS